MKNTKFVGRNIDADSDGNPDGTGKLSFTSLGLATITRTGGEFFVHVYRRTAVGSDYPNGDYYATVGKSWKSIPGRHDTLAGVTGKI